MTKEILGKLDKLSFSIGSVWQYVSCLLYLWFLWRELMVL